VLQENTPLKSEQASAAPWLQLLLQCPDCRGALAFADSQTLDAQCPCCSFVAVQSNFLPRRPVARSLELPVVYEAAPDLQAATIGPPPLTYSGPRPHRNAVDIFSLLPRPAVPGQAIVLDLGCGGGEYRPLFQELGYQYVGVDASAGAALRADAHALPFRDASFDMVFAMVVLQHLHNPFLALSEVRRVLKPAGAFLGVAAFGEPFHASYFHASAWALASLFHATDFKLERLWSCRDSLHALAAMSAYPRAVRWLLRGVALSARLPWLSPRRWWSGEAAAGTALATAGSIGFLAYKRPAKVQ
jgi:SAM-dependent methyltransferase